MWSTALRPAAATINDPAGSSIVAGFCSRVFNKSRFFLQGSGNLGPWRGQFFTAGAQPVLEEDLLTGQGGESQCALEVVGCFGEIAALEMELGYDRVP